MLSTMPDMSEGCTFNKAVRWRIPDVELVSAQSLADYFRGISDCDIDFMLKVAAYIPARLDALRNQPYLHPIQTADDVLKSPFADCGMKEFLFQHIMNAGGLKTRRVGLENVPIQVGHSCTEVLIDSVWRFVDASFGVYFSAAGSQRPLSLAEARKRFPDIEIRVGADPLFLGQPEGGYSLGWVKTDANIVIDPTDGMDVAHILETYILSRLLCAEEIKRETVTVPVDLREDASVFLGLKPDGSGTNLANIAKTRWGQFLPGLLFRLGDFEHGNVEHAFVILTDEPVRVSVGLELNENGSTRGPIFVTSEPSISPEFTPRYNEGGVGWQRRKVDVSGITTDWRITAEMEILPPFTTVRFMTPWSHFHAPRSYSFTRLSG